jgi:hypothetical protein
MSIAASLSLVVLMHLLALFSAFTYGDNMHRSSAIFEPLESQRGIIVRQSLLHKSPEGLAQPTQTAAEGYIHPTESGVF